jgi:hypothetical protein
MIRRVPGVFSGVAATCESTAIQETPMKRLSLFLLSHVVYSWL